MSAISERREQDVRKLNELAARTGNKVRVVSVSGSPPAEISLALAYRAVPSERYPADTHSDTRVTISLSNRYPFQEPKAEIKTRILHPNVYSNGIICLGVKWIPTEGLDLLVKRIVQLVTYDPAILNEQSPANRSALEWYRRTKSTHPTAFPTETVQWDVVAATKSMKWSNLDGAASTKTVVECPSCRSKLSVPAGKSGRVRCPTCKALFEAKS